MIVFKGAILWIFVLFGYMSLAQKTNKPQIPKDVVFTSRLFSVGHFPYTGALLNRHFNADFNLYYAHRSKGFFVYKTIDFEDFNSDLNYLQAGGFMRVAYSKTFSFTPYLGFIFLQTKGFSDRGSDVFFALQPTFRLRNWVIENTALFQNVLKLGHETTLCNRLEIRRSLKKISVSTYFFHNITLSENVHQALSLALLLRSPTIELAPRFSMQAGIMFQRFISDFKPEYAMRQGVVFSLNFPIDLSAKTISSPL